MRDLEELDKGRGNLDGLLKLAASLPWSSYEMIYAGLSRLLIEHIMMTSIQDSLLEAASLDQQAIKVSTMDTLTVASDKSGVVLANASNLVNLYVDCLFEPDLEANTEVSIRTQDVQSCAWTMGCPVTAKKIQNPNVLTRRLCSLEKDHSFPKSRKPRRFHGHPGEMICAYHNRYWKGPHIAFALPDDWIACKS